MSNTRYIELDSSYRNRNQWPFPAEFEVPIAQYGDNSQYTALDPVSDAAPILEFTGNFDFSGGDSITGTVSALTGLGALTDIKEIIIEFPIGTLQPGKDYYVGSVLNDTTAAELRRIDKYCFMEQDGLVERGLFRVVDGFRMLAAGDSITITNPSSNLPPNGHIFIPFSRVFDNNYYINFFLEDTTIDEQRRIISYDGVTSIATLESPFGAGWSNTDSYLIRKSLPYATGTLTASTINSFTLPASFLTTPNVFTGYFIRITSGPAAGDMRRIVSYSDPNTPNTTGTVSPAFSAAPGLADFELLPFSRDNYVELNYTGSLVSQQQEVCYEIELLNLTLPNQNLDVMFGNRIAFQPYVYVELTTSTENRIHSILYSNNPNAKKALFVAPIDDVTNPLVASFVKIDGDGAVQTVQFKPNTSLKFRVFMPDGNLFKTTILDQYSPLPPNPLIQIQAYFAIRRV
jgi:hypothetical protein